jgi:5-methylcytosine-specific restriction endonuclease McrA
MARTRDRGSRADRLDSAGVRVREAPWSWKKRVSRERKRLESDTTLAVCWLCGEPIDMALPYDHARGFTLDHLIPIARGGEWDGEAKPAHRSCNSARGDGRRRKRGATPPTLLDW